MTSEVGYNVFKTPSCRVKPGLVHYDEERHSYYYDDRAMNSVSDFTKGFSNLLFDENLIIRKNYHTWQNTLTSPYYGLKPQQASFLILFSVLLCLLFIFRLRIFGSHLGWMR
jgi:hypothetical protein